MPGSVLAVDGPSAIHASGRPAPALRPYVTAYEGFDVSGFPAGVHLGTPGRALTTVISLGDPLSIAPLDAGSPGPSPWPTVVGGLTSRSIALHHRGRFHGIKIGVTPLGARALYGVPASALAHQLLPLDDLLGPADELVDRLRPAGSWPERFRTIDEVLLRAVARRPRTTGAHGVRPEVAETWRRLVAARGRLGVGTLATELGWSRRHLGERFRREVGLPPKTFARIVRFEHAHALAAAEPSPAWAQISAASGYADQAHLVRDWHAFTGRTPTTWRRHEVIEGAPAPTAS